MKARAMLPIAIGAGLVLWLAYRARVEFDAAGANSTGVPASPGVLEDLGGYVRNLVDKVRGTIPVGRNDDTQNAAPLEPIQSVGGDSGGTGGGMGEVTHGAIVPTGEDARHAQALSPAPAVPADGRKFAHAGGPVTGQSAEVIELRPAASPDAMEGLAGAVTRFHSGERTRFGGFASFNREL